MTEEREQTRLASRMSLEERRAAVVDSFARYFGDKARGSDRYVERIHWAGTA